MRVGTTYPSFNYDIERAFKTALGNNTELLLIKTYEDLEGVDLLAFPGGEDVDPTLYNRNNTHSYGINHNRDERERFLYKHAKSLGKPMFGMCRGLQFLAVMLGNNLIQDIYCELEVTHKGTHEIEFSIESAVSRCFNTVNSLHHQGVYYESSNKNVLRFLKQSNIYVTSYYNNIIESFESDGIVATQFHPEFMFSKESNDFFIEIGNWVEKGGFTFSIEEYDKLTVLPRVSDYYNIGNSVSFTEGLPDSSAPSWVSSYERINIDSDDTETEEEEENYD